MKRFAILGILCSITFVARADVKVPAIFGDHMVLQRGVKIPIWGTASPGEKVTVKALNASQIATADEKGNWRVTMDPIQSEQPFVLTIQGNNTIDFTDVIVGEVWVCSGQSNMEFRLDQAKNAKEAIAAADNPQMRLFIVQHNYTDEPQADVKGGKWMVCSPDTVGHFSAVGYFFGLDLHKNLNVPVGLIESNWGGTRAEAWMPKDAFDRLHLAYEPQWTEEWLHPKQNPASTRPTPERPFEAPTVLFNGMINPIVGYAIRGVIWYQGESNAPHPKEYHDVMAALIKSWRERWGQGDFPFLIVQLANFHVPKNNNTVSNGDQDSGWPGVRESQAQLVKDVPNVGLAVTIDIGESRDIHPKNKQDVGKRLALAARKIAYGQDVEFSGPTLKSMQVQDGKSILTFDHASGGLVNKGDDLEGFEIAGKDGKYVKADAKIDGDKVMVSADDVKDPQSVRYGWSDDPKCTVYNKSELPMGPFETQAK
jgi:sialate O-acetylesterase